MRAHKKKMVLAKVLKQSEAKLVDLPFEIIIEILKFLPNCETLWLDLPLVCKWMKKIIYKKANLFSKGCELCFKRLDEDIIGTKKWIYSLVKKRNGLRYNVSTRKLGIIVVDMLENQQRVLNQLNRSKVNSLSSPLKKIYNFYCSKEMFACSQCTIRCYCCKCLVDKTQNPYPRYLYTCVNCKNRNPVLQKIFWWKRRSKTRWEI